jgi:Holliday junction resolvase RusA-like endonuclease
VTWRTFTVRGIPKAQPRVKAYRRGDRAGVYDPGTADGWKDRVIDACRRQVPGGFPTYSKLPCSVLMIFNMPRPKRLYRKKDPIGCIPHNVKPDLDNLVKSTLDAMNEWLWWADDAAVADLRAVKRYHCQSGWPGACITVWWKD